MVFKKGVSHPRKNQDATLSVSRGEIQRALGVVYTPNEVAEYISELVLGCELDRLLGTIRKRGLVRDLEKYLSLKILDPACGAGTFLLAALKTYKRRHDAFTNSVAKGGLESELLDIIEDSDYLHYIQRNLYGVDIDMPALEKADHAIREFLNLPPDTSSQVQLQNGDSLISYNGLSGDSNYASFFEDPSERTPFEWREAFPEAFNGENLGFDVILMNPPYVRLRPNLAEFLRHRLTSGDREIAMNDFSFFKKRLKEEVTYYKESGEYTYSKGYILDKYRLFIERGLRLLSDGGLIGCIVPSTLLGDISTSGLRCELLQNNQVSRINEYTEAARLFKNVTQSVCILSGRKGGSTTSFELNAGITDFTETERYKPIQVKLKQLRRFDTHKLAIPRVSKIGYQILKKLHVFSSVKSKQWLLCHRGELDLTLDKELIQKSKTSQRLIRGSHLSRYHLLRHRRTPSEFVDLRKLQLKKSRSERVKHVSRERIACQQVSNRAQRWRLKFAKIPQGIVLANSCNYIVTESSKLDEHLFYLLAVLNSDLVNWRFDLMNTNNHVSIYELNSLPFPNPSKIDENVMTCFNEEINRVQKNGLSFSPRIEGHVYSIFGLTKREAKYVMSSRAVPESEFLECLNEFTNLNK